MTIKFTEQQARKWSDKADDELHAFAARCSQASIMQAHLVGRGFPSTEMKALRDALDNVERALLDLNMAVITDLENNP